MAYLVNGFWERELCGLFRARNTSKAFTFPAPAVRPGHAADGNKEN
jgi:hypothetical protein